MPSRVVMANLGFRTLATAAAFVLLGLSAWLLWDVVAVAGQLRVDFLIQEPRDFDRAGGISSILVSTLLLLIICLMVAIPLALGSAIYLSEFVNAKSRIVRMVDASVTLLSSIPSVVFGLFGMVLFCQLLGFGFSLLAGGLTLACMVLPLLFVVVFATLRSIPNQVRMSAMAAGVSKSTMVWQLLLPTIRPQIFVGVVLATARALSETAALIFTSGSVTRMPSSIFDSGRSLSVHIYELALQNTGGQTNAKLTALVLLVLLCGVNSVAIWFLARTKSAGWIGR